MTNLPSNPTGFNALSPQQQKVHRAKIGARAEAILSQFWRDDETPDAVRALEIEGWIDVLESCSHSELRAAWAKYQRTGPRTQAGKLYKPDAGAIWHLVVGSRPKPQIVAPPPARAEPKQRISADRARQICEETGFKFNEHGGVMDLSKPFPKTGEGS